MVVNSDDYCSNITGADIDTDSAYWYILILLK